MRSAPQVLIPWNPAEAITVSQGAAIARKSPRTVREWAARYDIGRRVVGGDWMLSRVALLMLLESNSAALAAYLAGDRESQAVTDYFRRAEVGLRDGPA
ncbi:helix-turn-helix domain-containing protein [Methylobacterium sp. 37f]|uniref:helix-turn-helix domain-containing protein n=1 Tax=Methylobacterium sp. 37f TaxID=2817058 RepID=UPI001FFD7018|nr:helix-turn-helix domain-containing protein [Methylobacterium sp. 37f]MCK2056919.1 helix-turn-helix domain-containing protein [Methylobacterium sp. 37f]